MSAWMLQLKRIDDFVDILNDKWKWADGNYKVDFFVVVYESVGVINVVQIF